MFREVVIGVALMVLSSTTAFAALPLSQDAPQSHPQPLVQSGVEVSVPALAACMILLTFGEMIAMPMASAYLADLAPPEMRGRYMGISGLTWSTALILGPALGMKLYTVNASAYWMTCAALGIFAASVIWRVARPATGPNSPAPRGIEG